MGPQKGGTLASAGIQEALWEEARVLFDPTWTSYAQNEV